MKQKRSHAADMQQKGSHAVSDAWGATSEACRYTAPTPMHIRHRPASLILPLLTPEINYIYFCSFCSPSKLPSFTPSCHPFLTSKGRESNYATLFICMAGASENPPATNRRLQSRALTAGHTKPKPEYLLWCICLKGIQLNRHGPKDYAWGRESAARSLNHGCAKSTYSTYKYPEIRWTWLIGAPRPNETGSAPWSVARGDGGSGEARKRQEEEERRLANTNYRLEAIHLHMK